MKSRIYILAVAVVVSLTSCLDNFDMLNPNAEVVASTTKLSDSQAYLTSTYNALYDPDLWGFPSSEIAADMAFPGKADRYDTSTYEVGRKYYEHTYSNDQAMLKSRYAAIYVGIYRANIAIRELESLITNGYYTEDNTEWIAQMCQARALRGMLHFFAHSTFNNGDVVMFEFVPDTIAELSQPLSLSEDVITSFRADFQYAIDNWPDDVKITDGMITPTAARGFLGTSYLYEGEWGDCITTLQPIVDDSSLKLETDLALLFSVAGEFNQESIFEINYMEDGNEVTATNDYSTVNSYYDNSEDLYTYPAWLLWEYQEEKLNTKDPRNVVLDIDSRSIYTTPTASGDTVTLHEDVVVEDATLISQAGLSPDTAAGEFARYRTISMRASATSIIGIDNDHYYYRDTPQTAAEWSPGSKVGVARSRKFLNWDLYAQESDQPDGKNNSGRNLTILRLGGIYLMMAEAYIMQENVDMGLLYLNRIRDRWGLELLGKATDLYCEYAEATNVFDNVDYDQATLLKRLQDVERPLELSQEGYATRFIDLRRWGYEDYTKQRYLDLAKEKWVIYTFIYDGASGYGSSKKLWKLSDVYSDEMTVETYLNNYGLLDGFSTFYDYTEGAINIDLRRSYFPIPLTEIQNNQNLEKGDAIINFR